MKYELFRSHRRSILIQIAPTGAVVVKAPTLLPKFLIDQFVESKKEWIEKKVAVTQKFPLKIKHAIEDGDIYYYLGNPYVVTIDLGRQITLDKGKLHYPKHLLFRGKVELTNWYVKEAKRIITERVNFYANAMNTAYKNITYSDTSSKWGSCAPNNALQFNWRLVMAPILVLDYVVVHELSHTKEKNHGPKFWKIVAAYKPAYKQYIKWLKTNSNKLQIV